MCITECHGNAALFLEEAQTLVSNLSFYPLKGKLVVLYNNRSL